MMVGVGEGLLGEDGAVAEEGPTLAATEALLEDVDAVGEGARGVECHEGVLGWHTWTVTRTGEGMQGREEKRGLNEAWSERRSKDDYLQLRKTASRAEPNRART